MLNNHNLVYVIAGVVLEKCFNQLSGSVDYYKVHVCYIHCIWRPQNQSSLINNKCVQESRTENTDTVQGLSLNKDN